MQMFIGANKRRGDFGPRQKLAMAGGEIVGANPRRDIAAAVVVEFGDADPLDRGMPRRHLAAKQADPAGANDGEADAFGVPFHAFNPARLRCLSSAMPEIVSLVSGSSIGSLRSADKSAAL